MQVHVRKTLFGYVQTKAAKNFKKGTLHQGSVFESVQKNYSKPKKRIRQLFLLLRITSRNMLPLLNNLKKF